MVEYQPKYQVRDWKSLGRQGIALKAQQSRPRERLSPCAISASASLLSREWHATASSDIPQIADSLGGGAKSGTRSYTAGLCHLCQVGGETGARRVPLPTGALRQKEAAVVCRLGNSGTEQDGCSGATELPSLHAGPRDSIR